MTAQCKVTQYLSLISISLLLAYPALAGNVYKFSDDEGNVLFTNVVNSRQQPVGVELDHFKTLEHITWYPDTNVHSYGNWGRDESAVLPSFSKLRDAFDRLIVQEADYHQVDRGLVKAVIHTESGFNPKALSKPGAQGLMQLMPATAEQYGVTDPFDPSENVRAGTRHLKYLLDRYDRIELALAAYNAGEGNVEKYGGVPPFPETQDYIKRVISRYQHLYQNKI
ncbi:MAG TPA: lytic transglycosylase domain-containing protein [Porticoccaceae bacterium]|nr:lytic transglycosylase domain-containing protein [Porticoccaceae bacterium]